MSSTIIPKVLVTKIGFDGHDRGSRIVAAGLRDAGMEVIYTPPWQEIPTVVKLAMEEDVDVIGISSLATDHLLVRHRARRGRGHAAASRRRLRVPPRHGDGRDRLPHWRVGRPQPGAARAGLKPRRTRRLP
jgi:hypothetical protein